MNLMEVTEVRTENHKMQLPTKFRGIESDNQRSISFYSTSGKLAAATKDISAQGGITALATNCNLNHIAEMNNRVFFNTYVDQLFDPANWEIISFHNEAGRRVTASTVPNDPQVLMPVGDCLTNQAGAARRVENISFVQVKASINLSAVTNNLSSVYTIDTFIELPTEDKLILDGAGQDRTVHTFVGRSDIRM